MRTKRMESVVIAVCIMACLLSDTVSASSGMQHDHAGGNVQGGPPTAAAPSTQTAVHQNPDSSPASLTPSKNGSMVCPVTPETAPSLSVSMADALKLYRAEKLDEAIAAYNAILPAGGTEAAAAYAGLARAYLSNNDPDRAFEAAQKGVALTPDRPPAIVALGEVYFRQGKIEQAAATFRKPLY